MGRKVENSHKQRISNLGRTFEQEKALLQTATNQTIQNHKAMNAHLKRENELIKARCDSQERQQQIMQQQIAELTKIQNWDMDSNMASEPPTDYNLQRDKQDTPTAPTEMSNSPIRTQKTQKTNIAPQNLLESLSKPANHTPTRSRSLAAISETAQGISRSSPRRKHATTTSTSYTKGTTGGNQK
jgi:hypothetical protein